MRIYAIIALAGVVTAYVPPPQQRETRRTNVVVAAQSTLELTCPPSHRRGDAKRKNNVLNLPESEKITLETPLEAGRRGRATSS